MVIIIIFLTS